MCTLAVPLPHALAGFLLTFTPSARNLEQIPAANSMRTGDNLTTVVVRQRCQPLHCAAGPAAALLELETPNFPPTELVCTCFPALQLVQRGLFVATTSVTITNWLGSCAVACDTGERARGLPASGLTAVLLCSKVQAALLRLLGANLLTQMPALSVAPRPPCPAPAAPGWPAAPADVSAARLTWPPIVSTNIFDVSWVYNMRCVRWVGGKRLVARRAVLCRTVDIEGASLAPGELPRPACDPLLCSRALAARSCRLLC